MRCAQHRSDRNWWQIGWTIPRRFPDHSPTTVQLRAGTPCNRSTLRPDCFVLCLAPFPYGQTHQLRILGFLNRSLASIRSVLAERHEVALGCIHFIHQLIPAVPRPAKNPEVRLLNEI